MEVPEDLNVPTLNDVPAIRKLIHEKIEFYKDPTFPVMSKPLYNSELNRLELVLFAPKLEPTTDARPKDLPPATFEEHEKAKKNFTLAGADVVRKTMKLIKRDYPEVKRPEGRENKKDSQVDFKNFYDALLFLDTFPPELRAQIPES